MGLRLVSGPFDDPIQRVRVAFVAGGEGVCGPSVAGHPGLPEGTREGYRGDTPIELIAPLGDDAPIHQYLRKELGAYHICYEADDLDALLVHLRANRCLVVSGPVPAVAFGGRRIAWVFLPTRHLIEVVERG